jgi:hypothetical protein
MVTLRVVCFSVACLTGACAMPVERGSVVAHADGEQHLTVRTDANHLWWSHQAWSEPHDLWKLPSSGPVQNLTVHAIATDETDAVFVVTFDQGGSSWRGRFAVDPAMMIDTKMSFLRDLAMDSTLTADLAHSGR